ncbi:MAG: lipocalin-like domain-containing protein [Deltaproteobacteria bacterium]|nr:lipocalin-like domain-containing protein [Deltaproteobacteria bacterium]
MGKNPAGYVIYTSEGRMMVIITAEGRKAPNTDQDRAELMKTVFAYAATYRIEGDKLINKVDVSWNPALVGTEQTRFLKMDGDRLQVLTAWHVKANWPEKGMGRVIMTFERVK